MKWINAYDDRMPGRDIGLLLLKIAIHFKLQDKYNCETLDEDKYDHEVKVSFYALQSIDYWNPEKKYGLKKAASVCISIECPRGRYHADLELGLDNLSEYCEDVSLEWGLTDIDYWICVGDIEHKSKS